MDEMNKIRKSPVQYLEKQLSPVERAIVECLGLLNIASGRQLRNLFFEGNNESADGRRARWTLRRLYDLEVVSRYQRRLGGARAGSDGYVYRLGAQGTRLVRWWNDGVDARASLSPEPGMHTMDHSLEISGFYVGLKQEAAKRGQGRLEVVSFAAERQGWRTYSFGFGDARQLKPDAFVRLGFPDAEVDRDWFVEVDRGTVSQRTRASHAADYRDYWRSGVAEEEMPGVLWIAQNELVAEWAKKALQPHREPQGLFTITTIESAVKDATRSPIGGRP